MNIFLLIIDTITCSSLDQILVRVGIIVCLLHALSQSLFGVFYLSYPYQIGASIGAFFSTFFICHSRYMGNVLSDYLLWFFIAQQVVSTYAIIYGFSENETILFIIGQSYFLIIATFGVCFSYRFTELVRQRSSSSIHPLSQV
jgi:hypothetical protein